MRLKTLLLATLATAPLAPGPALAGDLDGTSWTMKLKGLRLKFWDRDELRFANDAFTSVDCLPYGFKAGPYASRKTADGVSWTAEQTNPEGERMAWEGVAKGDRMEGRFVWTRKDGSSKAYGWTARRSEHEHPPGQEPAKKGGHEHPPGQEHPAPR